MPTDARSLSRRNTWAFGPGTLGRDMVYTVVSMYLIVYLSEGLNVSDAVLGWTSLGILAMRLIDSFLDIVMGTIVDNTRTRWGSHKPWILGGMIFASVTTLLLFTDLGLRGWGFVVVFTLLYLLWGISWTSNDIPFWSLLPQLSQDPATRERMGSVAKTFGTVGLFVTVGTVAPVTAWLGRITGSVTRGWFVYVLALVVCMVAFQVITLLFVRIPTDVPQASERTTLGDMFRTLRDNDQLRWTGIFMVIFASGFTLLSSLGLYFFKYAYGDEGMYSVFALVLGIAQLIGFSTFPWVASKVSRLQIFRAAAILDAVGMLAYFFAPMNMAILAPMGFLMFLGISWIVMLSVVFLADTVEYGQWKLGRRNSAVTFSLQPFIYKVASAVATALTGLTLIVSGINRAHSPADVSAGGIWVLKSMMLLVPLTMILLAYVLYRRHYRITPALWEQMMRDLNERDADAHPA